MESPIDKEIREQLDQLPAAQQRQVLDFARALAAKKRRARSGQALSQFGGTIAKEDLAQIAQAIEEGCEQVNPDGQFAGHPLKRPDEIEVKSARSAGRSG